MTITTYLNESDERTINKAPTKVADITATMKEDSSIINPVFVFAGGASAFTGVNYIYVQEFARYYYVDDIVTDSNGMTILKCRVDVLMSNSSAINALTCVIERSTNLYNLYMDDGSFKVYQKPHVITREFPYGFSSPSYVLAIAGTPPSTP